jgi:hypothetical protein
MSRDLLDASPGTQPRVVASVRWRKLQSNKEKKKQLLTESAPSLSFFSFYAYSNISWFDLSLIMTRSSSRDAALFYMYKLVCISQAAQCWSVLRTATTTLTRLVRVARHPHQGRGTESPNFRSNRRQINTDQTRQRRLQVLLQSIANSGRLLSTLLTSTPGERVVTNNNMGHFTTLSKSFY